MSQQYNHSLLLKDTESKRQNRSKSFQGQGLIKVSLDDVKDTIQDCIDSVVSRRKPTYYTYLKDLDLNIVAYITLSVTIDALRSIDTSGRLFVASRISSTIVQEINYHTLESAKPGLIGKIQRYVRNNRSIGRVKDAVKGGEFNLDDGSKPSLVEWSYDVRIHVGLFLLSVLKHLGLVEERKVKRSNKWFFTDSAYEWLSNTYEDFLYYNPAYLPLTEPAKDYADELNYSYGSNFPPIKLRIGGRNFSKPQDPSPIPLNNGLNLDAVNRLGKQALQVNEGMYELLLQLWDRSIAIDSLVSKEPIPIPAPLLDPTPDALKERNSKASRAYIDNAHSHGRRVYMHRQIHLIKEYIGKPLYFVHTVDSRGRVYAVASTILNPQGTSLSKALLKFHDSLALPIGKQGYYYLLLSIAEYYGHKSLSKQDAFDWASTNVQDFLDIARNPFDRLNDWSNVDDPFLFMSSCMELLSMVEWGDETGKDIYQYPSTYIKYLDGKCSGLQHWSLLLRDRGTASKVGLTKSSPHEAPIDIYNLVLHEIIRRLQADGSDEAKFWLSVSLTRSTFKKPVMTSVFSSTKQTWRKQILESLPSEDKHKYMQLEERTTYIKFLTDLLEDVMYKELSSVMVGMDWIKSAVNRINSCSSHLLWTTPLNFDVHQSYKRTKYTRKEIRVRSLNSKIIFKQLDAKDELNTTAQTRSAPPNFIHSLDSAHLCSIVNSFDKPITVIHDSFGCCLSDVADMDSVIKTTLIELYSVDILYELKKDWEDRYGIELPSLPKYGTHEVKEVQQSSYAFT